MSLNEEVRRNQSPITSLITSYDDTSTSTWGLFFEPVSYRISNIITRITCLSHVES